MPVANHSNDCKKSYCQLSCCTFSVFKLIYNSVRKRFYLFSIQRFAIKINLKFGFLRRNKCLINFIIKVIFENKIKKDSLSSSRV